MGAVIRVGSLDGQWETLGAGRYRGVIAEAITASANPWGPDQLSFNVKQVSPGSLRPDLLPFVAVELEIDGMLVWAGRVRQRPSTDDEHQVTCEGWQYHLDDDAFARLYVATRLSEWVDVRTNLNYDLTKFTTSWGVETGSTVKISSGTVALGANKSAGVLFDAGVDSTVKRIILNWSSSNNDANIVVYMDSADTLPVGTGGADTIITLSGGASGQFVKTLTTARRYLMVWADATAHTPPNEAWFKLTDVKLFRDTAYESGSTSHLKSDQVIKDAIPSAPLLNQATDLINAGTFSIPEYSTNDYQSPRDIIESVNAYENFDLRIGGADLRTLVYAPKQTVPRFVVGEWSGAQFSDSSVAGEEIYNRVIVTGTGPDGGPLVSRRTQTGTLFSRVAATSLIGQIWRSKVLPIRSAGTSAVYDRFGDLWLADHKLAPFAGKLAATTGIRRWQGGATVPAHELLVHAGSRIHLTHRVDPDTGAWGRDGLIVGVTYNHDQRSLDLDIDDRRDHFESILQRYGILVDQFT